MEITLEYSELCVLLAEAGRHAPVGLDAAHFPPLNDVERQDILAAGRAKLQGRDAAAGLELVKTLAAPSAVLHATHVQPGEHERHLWFFYTPAQTVRLHKPDRDHYQLATVSGTSALLNQVYQFLPLQPAPPELTYRVRLPYDDFLVLRDLATEWEEVPALEILEADGLDQVSSRDLFDSAADPEWRGIIDCLSYQGQVVAGQATLRVLQGAEISWLIRPSTGDNLVAETAQPGLYQDALAKAWRVALA
jgi:hypothetical protein